MPPSRVTVSTTPKSRPSANEISPAMTNICSVASQLWNSDALSSGYGWQYNVQLRSIDESRALFVNVNDRILKLLRSRVKSATGETRAHYQGMIYVLERSLFPSQKN